MPKNGNGTAHEKKRTWPKDCIWPEPVEEGKRNFWEAEDAGGFPLDEEAEELLEIKEYMDELVQCGRLLEDYRLNMDYEDDTESDDPDEEDEPWEPEKGSDYWDEGFDIEAWTADLTDHLNLMKLSLPSPVDEIQRAIGYEFVNENLIRQAFTRKAFALEHDVGDSEVLEFLGDTALNTVLAREISRQLTRVDAAFPQKPFSSSYDEGDLTKIRQHFVCKEYLAARAVELEVDQYILYGSQEQPTESGREDMIEALIGAVAVDSDWNWYTLESVVDKILCVQLDDPHHILNRSYYDIFNSWHQRKFGRMPDYELSKGSPVRSGMTKYRYHCTLRYSIPENTAGIWTSQRVDVQSETRSKARELAAEDAYHFVINSGLWMNLADAGIEPRFEDSINQLQELYQKKYVEERPDYSFEESGHDEWYCSCVCGDVGGWGRGKGKTVAKKKAAYMVLVRLMKSAGICKEEWDQAMWKMME